MKRNTNKIVAATAMLLVSVLMLGTATYAWFAMNTRSVANGLTVEAYSDSNFLEISQNDVDYTINTTFTDNNTGLLRLVTSKRFDTSNIVKLTVTDVTEGRYNGTGTYYKAVEADTGTNYIFVNFDDEKDLPSSTVGLYKNPTFTLVTEEKVAEDGKNYFDFDKNSYKKVDREGLSVKGFYECVVPDAEVAGSVYDGTSVYYSYTSNTMTKVANLHLGADLSDYFTVVESSVTIDDDQKGDGTTVYYLKNGNDYSYVGTVSNAEYVKNYIYWGRAYSSDPTEVQENSTLNIIDKAASIDYYLQKTLYLRQAEGTNHATNLRVEDIRIGGATNSLNDALRVLLVATSTSDPTNIVTVLYDAGEDTYNGAAGPCTMFNTLLGNEAETIKVDVYVYFDGTDDVAKNTTMVGAVLNGQSVEIEFAIDELDYN